jgi:CheY-like chemotaxis protein
MNQPVRPRVLVVDDEEAVRGTISFVLSNAGFSVVEAANGSEAVELVNSRAGAPDVIVSDLNMPVMNGLELSRHNFDNWGLPFVVCTAVPDARFALKLLKHGVQDFVVKPIDRGALIGIVRAAIMRNLLAKFESDSASVHPGNVSDISVPAKRTQLLVGLDWIREKSSVYFTAREHGKYLSHTLEFLLNAFEHGSLNISEMEKTDLLNQGKFEDEVKERESLCSEAIKIEVAALKREILVRITDEGKGFDYKKYLNMSDDTILERLEMPNGRGILVAKTFFDSIEYDNGGSSVLLIKKAPQQPA